MEQPDRDLRRHLKLFSEECTATLKDLKEDSRYVKTVKVPIFRNGHLAEIVEETRTDYNMIMFDIKRNKRLMDNPHFRIAKNILTQKLKNRSQKNKLVIDDDLNETTIKQLSRFIIQYMKEMDVNSNGVFKNAMGKFNKHLKNNLFSTLYITPLYSVTGDFNIIRFSPYLYIQTVTPDVYSKIVRLQDLPLKEIGQYQKRLKFILACNVPNSSPDRMSAALEEYTFAVNLLKLFKDGNPHFGNMYVLHSEYLDNDKIELIPSHYEQITSYRPINITEQDAKRFCAFYKLVKKKCVELKNLEFLIYSIERLGMAYTDRTVHNKIVDYVIALEALLAGDTRNELVVKLAHKTAALCSNTDGEMLELWKFMKIAYHLRSGIVHGSKKRETGGFTVDDISNKLHKIVRRSILRTINLLDTYKTQKDILDELEWSVYDRQKLRALRKVWKSGKT